MRKQSVKLLAELASKYSKRTVVTLCRDLRSVEDVELEKLIVAVTKDNIEPKRVHAKPGNLPFDDTPTSRIEFLLVTQAGLAEPQAAAQLKRQLLRQGVEGSRIPALRNRNFSDWLSDLFASVPASRVMHAALELSRNPR